MADGSPRRTRRTSTPTGDPDGGARRSEEEPAARPESRTGSRTGSRTDGRRASGATSRRTESGRAEAGGRPDVYLDVPKLEVEHIGLKVEDLRAKVSLQAEVLNLLKLNVGVDAQLGSVELEIDGVSAEATLKVRLDEVAGIIDRVLTTIDRNPQILETIARTAQDAVREVGSGVGEAVGEVGSAAGDAVGELGSQAGSAVGELGSSVGEAAGDAVGSVGDAAGDVAGTATETVGGVAGDATGAVTGGSDGEGADEGAGESEAPKVVRRRRSPQKSSDAGGGDDDGGSSSTASSRRASSSRPRPARRANG
ncbi:hypothetical protein ACFPK1_19135 [Actinomycetospora rhizophila]|uniref:Uncharacterized protein n=1 Tax=Actinomycetospora rhizophila TaxID=1416876 RepID=A0ABV9ZIH8_9PSEU